MPVCLLRAGLRRGFHRGKLIPDAKLGSRPRKADKRHILTDTDGRLLRVDVHGADVQDRDGAKNLLQRSRSLSPFVERIFAPSRQMLAFACQATEAGMLESWSSGPRTRPTWCWKSYAACHGLKALLSSSDAGSLSAPSPGSRSAGGWSETTSSFQPLLKL